MYVGSPFLLKSLDHEIHLCASDNVFQTIQCFFRGKYHLLYYTDSQ